jgi:hypothetical protein
MFRSADYSASHQLDCTRDKIWCSQRRHIGSALYAEQRDSKQETICIRITCFDEMPLSFPSSPAGSSTEGPITANVLTDGFSGRNSPSFFKVRNAGRGFPCVSHLPPIIEALHIL